MRLPWLDPLSTHETVVFDRHARGYDLTEYGASLLSRIQEIEQKVQEVEQTAAQEARPEVIRISAGTWMTAYLAEKIGEIRSKDDVFRLYLSAEERRADIARREALIGFRNKRPEEPNLVTRKLCKFGYAVYAAAADVDGWIDLGAQTSSARWVRAKYGSDAAIGASTPTAALQLCLGGQGRMVLPCFVGDVHPGLERLSAPIDDLWQDSWMVTHHVDRHRPNVRRVIDRLVAIINADAPRFAGLQT